MTEMLSSYTAQHDTNTQECNGDNPQISSANDNDSVVGKKRKHTSDDEEAALNESSTIDDLANIDVSTYIAWVNRQSQAMPSVFVADKHDGTETKPNGAHHEEPIDGSAASLQVMLSKQMEIHPPPSIRHLPPMDTNGDSHNSLPMNHTTNCSQWISTTISNFSELRSQIEKAQSQVTTQQRKIGVPRMKDRAAWHVFCLGKNEASGNIGGYFEDSDDEIDVNDDEAASNAETDESKEKETKEETESDTNMYNPQLVPTNGYQPTLSLLLQFDQVLTRFLFHHHIHFVCEWKSPLTRNRAAWIYALLARMEKPWHREECSAVRRLLRECCSRRYELILPDMDCSKPQSVAAIDEVCIQSTSGDAIDSLEQVGDVKAWEQLALLNTLIAITGIYYEQGSMAGGDGMNTLFSMPK